MHFHSINEMKLKELVLSTKLFRDQLYESGKVLGVRFKYVPKANQLYVFAHVASGTEAGKKYNVLLVFNQVKYYNKEHTEKTAPDNKHTLRLAQEETVGKNGVTQKMISELTGDTNAKTAEVVYWLTQPDYDNNIMVRCTDPSFIHEFHWHDAKYKALIGPKIPYKRVPGSNRPPKNKSAIPGICKHIVQLILWLSNKHVIKANNSAAVQYMLAPRRKTK